jgi:hypothetical protein
MIDFLGDFWPNCTVLGLSILMGCAQSDAFCSNPAAKMPLRLQSQKRGIAHWQLSVAGGGKHDLDRLGPWLATALLAFELGSLSRVNCFFKNRPSVFPRVLRPTELDSSHKIWGAFHKRCVAQFRPADAFCRVPKHREDVTRSEPLDHPAEHRSTTEHGGPDC